MLEQLVEVLDTEVGLTQDCAKRPPVEFFVVGNDQLGKRIVATQDDMGAVLPLLVKTGFNECLDAIATRKPRQFAHTATSIVSKCSLGTGSPSSCKAAT